MFKALPGNEYVGNSQKEHFDGPKAKFQSKKIVGRNGQSKTESYGDMLIIKNSDQFIPYCIFRLSK